MIATEKLDVLIFADIGMEPFTATLAQSPRHRAMRDVGSSDYKRLEVDRLLHFA